MIGRAFGAWRHAAPAGSQGHGVWILVLVLVLCFDSRDSCMRNAEHAHRRRADLREWRWRRLFFYFILLCFCLVASGLHIPLVDGLYLDGALSSVRSRVSSVMVIHLIREAVHALTKTPLSISASDALHLFSLPATPGPPAVRTRDGLSWVGTRGWEGVATRATGGATGPWGGMEGWKDGRAEGQRLIV